MSIILPVSEVTPVAVVTKQFSAPGSLVLQVPDSLVSIALASTEIGLGSRFSGLSSLSIGTSFQSAAEGGLTASGGKQNPAPGSLEVSGEDLLNIALASLNTGASSISNSPGSLEIASSAGVDFIIDIIDEILSSSGGDCL